MVGLLRHSVFGRLAGYEDVNDADRLCRDPAMRWIVGDQAITGSATSASQMGRFETKWLCQLENLAAPADLPGQWIDKVHERRPPRVIVLDMASSESPTYGEPEGRASTAISAVPATTRCSCSTRSAALCPSFRERPQRRRLTRGTGAGGRSLPGHGVKRLYFRGDAAFANPEIYEFLEAEGIGYTIRCRPIGSYRTGWDIC